MSPGRESFLVKALVGVSCLVAMGALIGVVTAAQSLQKIDQDLQVLKGRALRPGAPAPRGPAVAASAANGAPGSSVHPGGDAAGESGGAVDPAVLAAEAALPVDEQMQHLRQELERMRTARDQSQQTLSALQAQVAQVEANQKKSGENTDFFSGLAKMSAMSEYTQLKKRLKLRPDQKEPILKVLQDQYTATYGNMMGGEEEMEEGGDAQATGQAVAERFRKAQEESQKKIEACLDNWQVNEYRKMKTENTGMKVEVHTSSGSSEDKAKDGLEEESGREIR